MILEAAAFNSPSGLGLGFPPVGFTQVPEGSGGGPRLIRRPPLDQLFKATL